MPEDRPKPAVDMKKLISSVLMIAVGLWYMLRDKDLWVIALAVGGTVALLLFVVFYRQSKAGRVERGDRT